MMLDDFLAMIPEEDKQRIDKQIDKMLEQENKKQSSIEWLKEVYINQGRILNSQFDQAKAMHKEEILQTFEKGYVCGYRDNGDGGIDYYNETFGDNNE